MSNNLLDSSFNQNNESIDIGLFTPFSPTSPASLTKGLTQTSSGYQTSSANSVEGNTRQITCPNSSNSKSFISPNKSVKRKFPGPAGILPDENISASQMLSQTSASDSQNLPWLEMGKDFKISNLFLYDRFNITWIKKEASLNRLVNQKSPFLAAMLHSVEVSDMRSHKVVNVTLKDLTGEIQGTIVYNLYEEHCSNLRVGSVIVLKDFGILSCNCDNCDNFHLTITPNNLATIYTLKREEELEKVEKIVITDVNLEDIIRSYTRDRQKLDESIREKQSRDSSSNRFQPQCRFKSNMNSPQNLNSSIRASNISNSNGLHNSINANFKDSTTRSSPLPFLQQSSSLNKQISYRNSSNCGSVLGSSNILTPVESPKSFRFNKLKGNNESDKLRTNISEKNSSPSCSNSIDFSSECKKLNGSFLETIKMGATQVSVTANSKEHANVLRTLLEDIDFDALLGEF